MVTKQEMHFRKDFSWGKTAGLPDANPVFVLELAGHFHGESGGYTGI
jgi:hypothetical protein